MTIEMFIFCIAVGAGAIALWVDVRFPKLMPWSMRRLLVHIIVVGPAMGFVARSGVPAANLASVFCVAFPVLVYEFLVGAWMIKLAQATGAGFRS
jgi:hypothetical protein